MGIIYLFKYVMPTLFFDFPKTATKRLGRRILKLLSSGNFGFVKTLKIWDTSPFCVLVSWHPLQVSSRLYRVQRRLKVTCGLSSLVLPFPPSPGFIL